MHGQGLQGKLEAGETSINIEEDKASLVDVENGSDIRVVYLQVDVDTSCAPPTNIPQIGINPSLESSESIQNLSQRNLNTATDDNYSLLLNKYYQIEEQRQTILQQLQQFGNLSCQASVSDTQYGVYPFSGWLCFLLPVSIQVNVLWLHVPLAEPANMTVAKIASRAFKGEEYQQTRNNSGPMTVTFTRRTSSGRYISYSGESNNLDSKIGSGEFLNYTVQIPSTPDNQPMDPTISRRVEEQYVSNSLFTGRFNSVTRAHLMDKVIDS